MVSEKKDRRIPVMFSSGELEQIDGWRQAHRIWSRGEAIRQLIQRTLSDATPTDAPAFSLPAAHLRGRVELYRRHHPYLESVDQAAAMLIERALDLEERDDVVELDYDLASEIRRMAGPAAMEAMVKRLLRNALDAIKLHRELEREEALDASSRLEERS